MLNLVALVASVVLRALLAKMTKNAGFSKTLFAICVSSEIDNDKFVLLFCDLMALTGPFAGIFR